MVSHQDGLPPQRGAYLDSRLGLDRVGSRCVWMFGCLDVWMFGCLDVWMFGCSVRFGFGLVSMPPMRLPLRCPLRLVWHQVAPTSTFAVPTSFLLEKMKQFLGAEQPPTFRLGWIRFGVRFRVKARIRVRIRGSG